MARGEEPDQQMPTRLYSPDGSKYWSAERRELSSQQLAKPVDVEGPEIRFMPEYGVDVPLWDAGGPVDDDAAWLQEHLGIGPTLAADLAVWGHAWDNRDAWDGTRDAWRAEGQRLFDEVRARLPDGLRLIDCRSKDERPDSG